MQLAFKYQLQIILGWMACFNFVAANPLRRFQRDSNMYGETRLMRSNLRQDDDVEVKQLKELKGMARRTPVSDYAKNKFSSYNDDYDYDYRDQKAVILDPEELAYYIRITGNRKLVARLVQEYLTSGMLADEKEAVKYLQAIEVALKMIENHQTSLNMKSMDAVTDMLRKGKMKKDTQQTAHSIAGFSPKAGKLPDVSENENQSELSSNELPQNMSKQEEDEVIYEQGMLLIQYIFGKDGIKMVNTYKEKIDGLVDDMDLMILQGNTTKERKEEVLKILESAAEDAFFGNEVQSGKQPNENYLNDNQIRKRSLSVEMDKAPEINKKMNKQDEAVRKQVVNSILKKLAMK